MLVLVHSLVWEWNTRRPRGDLLLNFDLCEIIGPHKTGDVKSSTGTLHTAKVVAVQESLRQSKRRDMVFARGDVSGHDDQAIGMAQNQLKSVKSDIC
jgi:hypothetical protein